MKRSLATLAAVFCLTVCCAKAQVSVAGLTPGSSVSTVVAALQPYLTALLSNIYASPVSLTPSSASIAITSAGDRGLVIAFTTAAGPSGHVFMPYYNTNSLLAGLPVTGISTCAGSCSCTMTIVNGSPTSCGCGGGTTGGCTFGTSVEQGSPVPPMYWRAILE